MGKGKELKKEVSRRRRTGSFPSPSSSSSSDFEFIVSLSPSSRRSSSHLCPADELFYKGQLLPLHLSPRISMVRTLILASSSTSSSSTDATTTASRDSSSSSAAAECDSSRPSSVTEEDETQQRGVTAASSSSVAAAKRSNYFSALANRFSVFLHRGGGSKKLDASGDLDFQQLHAPAPAPTPTPTGKRSNSSAKQVIKKYVKKVKPLYEKLSSSQKNQNQSQSQSQKKKYFSFSIRRERDITLSACNIVESMKKLEEEEEEVDDRGGSIRGMIPQQSYSFSGNLRYPRRKRCAGSCPSSMRSSPTHSGLLRMNGGGPGGLPEEFPGLVSSSSSSMEELQSAVQGAIAHCKSTMIQPSDLAFM